jgi:hypothetical protein
VCGKIQTPDFRDIDSNTQRLGIVFFIGKNKKNAFGTKQPEFVLYLKNSPAKKLRVTLRKIFVLSLPHAETSEFLPASDILRCMRPAEAVATATSE